MFRSISLTLGAMLLASLALASSQGTKKQGSLVCTLTNTKVQKCCCEKRDGKLYCTLARKSIEKCCCVTASKQKRKRA